MDKKILIILFFLITSLLFALDYKQGDKVDVEYNGLYYPAEILKSANNLYFIHYTGYDSSWDEWVDIKRIKPVDKEEIKPEKNPVKKDDKKIVYYDPYDFIIKKSGVLYAEVLSNKIIINGKTAGEFDIASYLYINGKEAGHVDARGNIWAGNKIVANFLIGEGIIKKNGKQIGLFNYGEIYLYDKLWGTSLTYLDSEADTDKTLLFLTFFVPEFGLL